MQRKSTKTFLVTINKNGLGFLKGQEKIMCKRFFNLLFSYLICSKLNDGKTIWGIVKRLKNLTKEVITLKNYHWRNEWDFHVHGPLEHDCGWGVFSLIIYNPSKKISFMIFSMFPTIYIQNLILKLIDQGIGVECRMLKHARQKN
jgi:hypothetical protein